MLLVIFRGEREKGEKEKEEGRGGGEGSERRKTSRE